MNNKNTVSVIIPAYNAEAFIAETINSALAQTLPPYEIIVIDDGSKDNTANIVSQFDYPVRLIRQENQGVSAARNTGIRNATGNFIAFLDADDLWTTSKLEEQLQFFENHPDAGTVITDELYFVDDHKVIVESYLNKTIFAPHLPIEASILKTPITWLFTESFVGTSSVVCRKEVLDKAGLFDESLSICEDRDMWIKLAFEAPLGLIPEVMIHKRQEHGGNISDVSQEKIIQALDILLSRHKEEAYQAIKKEGGSPNKIYAGNYKRFADYYWYRDNFSAAQRYYMQTLKNGACPPLSKIILCLLGSKMIYIARKISSEIKQR